MNDFWGQYWWLVVVAAVWEVVWKAFALWRAAKNDDKVWFVALIILNTAGILDILYLFVFSKHVSRKKQQD